MRRLSLLCVSSCLLSLANIVNAANWYCDPVNGSSKGDGSSVKPWGTLADSVKLLKTVAPGDTVYLRSGRHGDVSITNFSNPTLNKFMVTIAGYPGEAAILNKLVLRDQKNWTIRDLTICPPVPMAGSPQAATYLGNLLEATACDDVLLMNNVVTSRLGNADWPLSDWTTLTAKWGIVVSGNRISVVNNTVRAVRFGIQYGGDSITSYGNTVDLFGDDAMDCTASNVIIRGNTITNLYSLDVTNTSHHDGLQLFPLNTPEGLASIGKNVLVEQNTIIYSTGTYAFLPKLPSGKPNEVLQGIYLGDGKWQNVKIFNNVILNTAANGIAMAGVNGCEIVNNTVLSQITDMTAPVAYSSIVIRPGKDGTAPRDSVVRNNISNLFSVSSGFCDHNISLLLLNKKNTWGTDPTNMIATDPKQLFMNYSQSAGGMDLHLVKANGNAINWLQVDHDGVNRRATAADDIGAFYFTGR